MLRVFSDVLFETRAPEHATICFGVHIFQCKTYTLKLFDQSGWICEFYFQSKTERFLIIDRMYGNFRKYILETCPLLIREIANTRNTKMIQGV